MSVNIRKVVESLPQYVQALYSDSLLQLNGDEQIATNARKDIVLSGIKLVKEQINALEQHFNVVN